MKIIELKFSFKSLYSPFCIYAHNTMHTTMAEIWHVFDWRGCFKECQLCFVVYVAAFASLLSKIIMDVSESNIDSFISFNSEFSYIGMMWERCVPECENTRICPVFCRGRDFATFKSKCHIQKLSRCTIRRVWVCVGTNPKQICSDLPWHDNYVSGDVAKTGHKLSLHCGFSRKTSFKSNLKLIKSI